MINLSKKKKIIFIILLVIIILVIYLFINISKVVRDGYDRQNKLVLFTKKLVPDHYIKKVKENIFIISNLKSRNEFLELQVAKYEQGLKGKKFKSEIINLNNEKYEINYFFTPFKRLDVNLGWSAEINSLRAHYIEFNNDKSILISGEGQTIYFDKKNLKNEYLNFQNLPNNINQILESQNLELIGIRDLYFHNEKIFISLMTKGINGITLDIYNADLNYEKLEFKLFFNTNEFWENYNVFSGGRIERFDKDNILFSIGYSNQKNVAQDLESLLGKIIKINLLDRKYEIISLGHRNPQGLRYIKNENIIINSEHGPVGGDELNLNRLDSNKIPNYGWDIASYGSAYDGTDPYKKSHEKYGFVEPSLYYSPSIGISEILYLEKNKFCKNKCLWVSSLRANSIYIVNLKKDFNKFVPSGRIHLKKNRIRDLDYDEDLDLIILLSENLPAVISINKI